MTRGVHLARPTHRGGRSCRSPVAAEVAEHLRRWLDREYRQTPDEFASVLVAVVRRDGPSERLWTDALQGALVALLDADTPERAHAAIADAETLLDDLEDDRRGL